VAPRLLGELSAGETEIATTNIVPVVVTSDGTTEYTDARPSPASDRTTRDPVTATSRGGGGALTRAHARESKPPE
jgi:hypothetical protein